MSRQRWFLILVVALAVLLAVGGMVAWAGWPLDVFEAVAGAIWGGVAAAEYLKVKRTTRSQKAFAVVFAAIILLAGWTTARLGARVHRPRAGRPHDRAPGLAPQRLQQWTRGRQARSGVTARLTP